VVVSTSFPRHPDDGAGHFVAADAAALAAAGHEVHVVCAGGSWRQPPERRGPLTIHWAGAGGVFTWPGAVARLRQGPWRALALPAFAAAVRWRWRQLGAVDRAVAHWLVPSAWPLLASCPVPLTVVAHGADVRLLCALPARLRRHVIASLLSRRTAFRFVAAALRDQLLAALDEAQAAQLAARAHVEPCPVLVPKDLAARAGRARDVAGRRPGPGAEPVAAVVGRLIPEKRVDLAIRGLAQLTPPPQLVVIGEGPERAHLEQLARRLGLPATFLGHRPRTECLQAMAAADVLLHCSELEAAPTVVREARACGVPVVATPAGDVTRWAAADPQIVTAAPHPAAVGAALQVALNRRNRAPSLQNEAARGTNGPC